MYAKEPFFGYFHGSPTVREGIAGADTSVRARENALRVAVEFGNRGPVIYFGFQSHHGPEQIAPKQITCLESARSWLALFRVTRQFPAVPGRP